MSKKGKLLVFSGPSGAGKGTICSRVMDEIDRPMELSISMTTRKPRVGEVDGKNYYFVTIEQFINEIQNQGLLEYAQVYDNYYGTLKKMVLEKLNQGIDVVLEIDIQGALQVKENYPEAILIFVLPPSMGILRKRLMDRATDDKSVIEKRLGETLKELSFIERYNYCVINDDLDRAVQDAKYIVQGKDLDDYKISKKVLDVVKKYKEEVK